MKEYSMSGLEYRYAVLLRVAEKFGVKRHDRTGVGSRSLFNQNLNWNLAEGRFPMLTGRRMYEKTFKTEFDWFINGETNIRRFQDAGVKIWDAWADENGDLGPVYGYQMLNFNGEAVNQLENVIDSLRMNHDSRRHIISLWNPLQINEMKLPPCYLYFQFFVEGDKLNMFVVQRSGDLFLGIPYDMALFSQILLYVAQQTYYLPNKIDLQIVDAHIYENQILSIGQYMEQEFFAPPEYTYENNELKISNYRHGPRISAPVAV